MHNIIYNNNFITIISCGQAVKSVLDALGSPDITMDKLIRLEWVYYYTTIVYNAFMFIHRIIGDHELLQNSTVIGLNKCTSIETLKWVQQFYYCIGHGTGITFCGLCCLNCGFFCGTCMWMGYVICTIMMTCSTVYVILVPLITIH